MKRLTIYSLTSLLLLVSNAQKPLFFSGGVSMLVGWDRNSVNGTVLPSFTLAPGVKIIQKRDFTVLSQLPLSFGISFQNDENNKVLTYAGIDLPLTFNLLFGPGFNNQSKAKAGFLVGAGIGYHLSENEIRIGGVELHHLRFTGVMINAGPTFQFAANDPNSLGGMMIRLSWLARYTDLKKNVVGLGLIFW